MPNRRIAMPFLLLFYLDLCLLPNTLSEFDLSSANEEMNEATFQC